MDTILEVNPRAFERWGITVDQQEDDDDDGTQPVTLQQPTSFDLMVHSNPDEWFQVLTTDWENFEVIGYWNCLGTDFFDEFNSPYTFQTWLKDDPNGNKQIHQIKLSTQIAGWLVNKVYQTQQEWEEYHQGKNICIWKAAKEDPWKEIDFEEYRCNLWVPVCILNNDGTWKQWLLR